MDQNFYQHYNGLAGLRCVVFSSDSESELMSWKTFAEVLQQEKSLKNVILVSQTRR